MGGGGGGGGGEGGGGEGGEGGEEEVKEKRQTRKEKKKQKKEDEIRRREEMEAESGLGKQFSVSQRETKVHDILLESIQDIKVPALLCSIIIGSRVFFCLFSFLEGGGEMYMFMKGCSFGV